jgi:hypothetical protein
MGCVFVSPQGENVKSGQTVGCDMTSHIKSQIAAGHKTVSFALEDLSKSNWVVELNSCGAPGLIVT